MRFLIKHEVQGRLRIHVIRNRMTCTEADVLCWALEKQKSVIKVKVYERTADAVIYYTGDREELIHKLKKFHFEKADVPDNVLSSSGRALNSAYREKLIAKTLLHYGGKLLLPNSVRKIWLTFKVVQYIGKGIRCLARRKIEVPVLDATAIGVSVLRGDFNTAGSVMFLLGIGELLEEWTHKKSVGDLARSMSLNIKKVWLKREEQEILVPASDILPGDRVIVHMGNVIPFDGEVSCGEGMVNQASLTGESLPVRRTEGQSVYAGTVLEEGELEIIVRAVSGATRFEKIVTMIEDSEKLKSNLESKAEHLADRLVPYTLLGTGLVWAVTRNMTKALSVLMVDFSCALKLAMPLSVLSAMREANSHRITVKGCRFLEAVSEAHTIVFDKTGTLTKAEPVLADIVVFNDMSQNEILKIAACLEEHFPHSMANAVVKEAINRKLVHEEMHSKVDYIVAHGIATYVNDERVVIGSHHFVFDDEKCIIPEEHKKAFDELPPYYSHLYMAIGGKLAAVLLIEDPLRPEAKDTVEALRSLGIKNIVMMTGDSERTARAIAEKVGVDRYFSEVLPEDKAGFVEREKALGHKVIMIGDGINDSPALSAADVGIAISEGAEIAREIADITISEENLYQLVTLKAISNGLMKRIHGNYRFVIGFNLGLILLGVAGVIAPATSALLHNTSTLGISLKSMTNLLNDQEKKKEYEEAEA